MRPPIFFARGSRRDLIPDRPPAVADHAALVDSERREPIAIIDFAGYRQTDSTEPTCVNPRHAHRCPCLLLLGRVRIDAVDSNK